MERSSAARKEKALGPATKPKHEVLKKLAEYIAEYTGKLAKQGESISTFAECGTPSARKEGRVVDENQIESEVPL